MVVLALTTPDTRQEPSFTETRFGISYGPVGSMANLDGSDEPCCTAARLLRAHCVECCAADE